MFVGICLPIVFLKDRYTQCYKCFVGTYIYVCSYVPETPILYFFYYIFNLNFYAVFIIFSFIADIFSH